MDISAIFSDDFPAFLLSFCESEPMQRIRRIGMNCGCEYTSFSLFRDILVFSRYDHSVGAARIVWHFTHDPAQTLSALFHDVATPTFAHTVDFLFGDYLTQEATELGIDSLLQADSVIMKCLHELGLTVSDVSDYHRYPIADNDSPRLSSDRLEYTLRNFVSFHLGTIEEAKSLYDDIIIGRNEEGIPELSFRSAEKAIRFASIALDTGRIYVSREDRCAMQRLAEILEKALEHDVLTIGDLYTTEDSLIEKLLRDPMTAGLWQSFRASAWIESRDSGLEEAGWRQIHAKKRYIDPLIVGLGRVSDIDPGIKAGIEEFKNQDFSEWMKIHEDPTGEKDL